MAPAAAYNPSPGQPQPTGTPGWRMHPPQQHQEQHQYQQHQHQYQHQHQHPQHQQQQQQQHTQPLIAMHPAVTASHQPSVPGSASGLPNSPQALMNALSLLQQNIGALQTLIPLMAQQQQQQPSDTAQAQQLQQQQAAASASVASVISQLALAASNILPQMGMASPALTQIGMPPAVPAGNPSAPAPPAVNSAGNPATQLLTLPQHGGFQLLPQQSQHQHQPHPQPQQQQQQQFASSAPANRQQQLISSLGASGSLLQQQAAQLTLATQSPPAIPEQQHQQQQWQHQDQQQQQHVTKLPPPSGYESDDVAAKLQLSQPGFAPSVAAPLQTKATFPPRPVAQAAPPQAQAAPARQFPKQGAVDKLLGGAILLSQKRKLFPDGEPLNAGANSGGGGAGAGGSDLARKRSKENVREDGGGKERGSPDGDDDESLPDGSFDVIEMDPVELLAEHTHFCEICGKGFKRDANLRMHMRGHGDEYKTPEALARPDKHLANVVQRPKRFSCPFVGCKRNSQHQRFLPLKTMLCVKNHYRRTHCPKMLACSKCGAKRFSVVADLKTHEKHCGRDRWLCSCGTSFSRKDKLAGHLALFKGHRPANPTLTGVEDGTVGAIADGASVEPPVIAGPSSAPALPQAEEREAVVYQHGLPAQLTLGQPGAPGTATPGSAHGDNGGDGGGHAILFGMSESTLVTADFLGSAEKQSQQ
ncbi:hypothetical protein CLOM_g14663 [Closterium sp. NIES-68]|nr:hypothetical protein CLOM_g14663 [Closterium sp. NIES-68]GJP81697.1 hypothetical protein CLOP_g11838 [Closterium sp. NIES-67]